MRRMIFVVSMFCFIQAYAKTPPIPEALLNAKTAFVANEGAEVKDFEKLCKLLKEWGRFELVQDQSSADIVIKIYTRVQNRTVQMPSIGGGISGTNTIQEYKSFLHILDVRDGSTLWSDETSGNSKDPTQLVNKLKNNMKKK